MDSELKKLRIDRKPVKADSGRKLRYWVLAATAGAIALVGVAAASMTWNSPQEVEVTHASLITADPAEGDTILSATGYIVTAHKIEVAAKVVGRVAWIGIEKGDHVSQGQVLVRLEDDEYRARLLEAQGQWESLKAKLQELENGSRPEEIARAKADYEEASADMVNAGITLQRTRELAKAGVLSQQALDDAQGKYDSLVAKTASLQNSYLLARRGTRQEEIDSMRAQVRQAKGELDYAQTQLDATEIRAPVSGVILERNVEKGEFVTTGFVGDKGAKGYVLSMADLGDLEVELDIGQNDFAKIKPDEPAVVTTDAYPDRRYQGEIHEIAPEANRQKATVQVKVRIDKPDEYLRPEMNATVAFLATKPRGGIASVRKLPYVPASAIQQGYVFLIENDHVRKRPVQTATSTPQGVPIVKGLSGGEELVLNPSAQMKDGQRVRVKRG